MGTAEKSVSIGGVTITHPTRVLYPDVGVTKLELAEFYFALADRILPHLTGRPLSVVRCPAGLDPGAAIGGIHQTFRGPRLTKCFFQKHSSKSTAGAIRTVRAPEHNGMADYLTVDDEAGLGRWSNSERSNFIHGAREPIDPTRRTACSSISTRAHRCRGTPWWKARERSERRWSRSGFTHSSRRPAAKGCTSYALGDCSRVIPVGQAIDSTPT
jgi:hypothetical protein